MQLSWVTIRRRFKGCISKPLRRHWTDNTYVYKTWLLAFPPSIKLKKAYSGASRKTFNEDEGRNTSQYTGYVSLLLKCARERWSWISVRNHLYEFGVLLHNMGSISTCVSYPGKVLTAECIGGGERKKMVVLIWAMFSWKILVSIQIPIWKGTKITSLVPILYNILVLLLKMCIISIGCHWSICAQIALNFCKLTYENVMHVCPM